MEMEMNFRPLQHPMEPLDEDRPIKCPMLSSSFNDGKEGEEEERVAAERWRRRSEQPKVVKKGIVVTEKEEPLRAMRKRQHILTNDGDHIILKPLVRMHPLLPTQNFTVFQMLQEYDEFHS